MRERERDVDAKVSKSVLMVQVKHLYSLSEHRDAHSKGHIFKNKIVLAFLYTYCNSLVYHVIIL